MPRSTQNRWLHISDLTIGDVQFNDAIDAGGQATAEMVSSNSENDSHANRFIQGVQLSETQRVSTYDIAGAMMIRGTRLGKGTSLQYTINAATESPGLSDRLVACSSPYCFIQNVSYDISKDQQAVAVLDLVFKSPDGQSFALSM